MNHKIPYGHKDNIRNPPQSELEMDLNQILESAKHVGRYESSMGAEHKPQVYAKLKYYREQLKQRKELFLKKFEVKK